MLKLVVIKCFPKINVCYTLLLELKRLQSALVSILHYTFIFYYNISNVVDKDIHP